MSLDNIRTLKSLADPFEEFILESNSVTFYRGGSLQELIFFNDNKIGLVVKEVNGSLIDTPFTDYIKNNIIGLPKLAGQIIKSIQNKFKQKSITPIDGPLMIEEIKYNKSKDAIINELLNPPYFSTGLIQLMAPAGQGKSVMLDSIALDLAKNYNSNDIDSPLLLNIDLLGRYVGTIEDAIAGSLNNTFAFPLSQRDIILCLEHNWIALSLDGFDELVARVGSKDAFQKLTEIIDQAKGHGTIIISARESFFETHQIKYSSHSYLNPRIGLFEKKNVFLTGWEHQHRESLLSIICKKSTSGSCLDIQSDYEQIKRLFNNDEKLLDSPFFLTKIGELWYSRDESLLNYHDVQDHNARIQYVIESYISREANEKWVTKSSNIVTDSNLHTKLLSFIAEEIMRSSTQRLSLDELQLSAELAISDLNIERSIIEMIVDKISIHAVFDVAGGQFTFSHIQFLNYYLANRLFERFLNNNLSEFRAIYEDKEIQEEVFDWLKWLIKDYKKNLTGIWSEENPRYIETVNDLKKILGSSNEFLLRRNISTCIAILLDGSAQQVQIDNALFTGNSLRGLNLQNITFTSTDFLQIDLSQTSLNNIYCRSCKFIGISVSESRKFSNVVIEDDTSIDSITIQETDKKIFSPKEIVSQMSDIGFVFPNNTEPDVQENARTVRDYVINGVIKMIKKSYKNHYFNIQEIEEEQIGGIARAINKAGVDSGVLKEKTVHRSGPSSVLVCFDVDREKLIEGSVKIMGNRKIDEFWDYLERI